MRGVGTVLAVALLVSGASAEEYWVEADLNGVFGDPQPDSIVTSVGQAVPADIWVVGSPNACFISFGMMLCNGDGALDYENIQYYSFPGWSGIPPQPPDAMGCIIVQFVNFVGTSFMTLPYRIATVTYRAAVDNTMTDLTSAVGLLVQTCLSFDEDSYVDDGEVIARIRIGTPTSTEATSWGSVKSLFR